MTNDRTILFRCDGTSQTGLGHTSRSLALAEALIEQGVRCVFLGHFDATVSERLRNAGVDSLALEVTSWGDADAAALHRAVTELNAIGVVLDSYLAGAGYVAAMARAPAPTLLIDDFAALPSYACAAVLNFTSRAEDFSYPSAGTRYYLGPRWFLGRRSLRELRARGARATDSVRQVLVSSGGNDPFDVVLPFVRAALACDSSLCMNVVVRDNYPNRQALEALLSRFSGPANVLNRLPDLSLELAKADVCLASAGLTKYEAAYLGVPTGVLSQNDGQARDAAKFAALGMTEDLGLAENIDEDLLVPCIKRMLFEREVRVQLQQRCFGIFPLDPTRDLALSVLTEVFRRA